MKKIIAWFSMLDSYAVQYDQQGRITHCVDSGGYEYWIEYDDIGKIERYIDNMLIFNGGA
jgi:YD repeat-containing protein